MPTAAPSPWVDFVTTDDSPARVRRSSIAAVIATTGHNVKTCTVWTTGPRITVVGSVEEVTAAIDAGEPEKVAADEPKAPAKTSPPKPSPPLSL